MIKDKSRKNKKYQKFWKSLLNSVIPLEKSELLALPKSHLSISSASTYFCSQSEWWNISKLGASIISMYVCTLRYISWHVWDVSQHFQSHHTSKFQCSPLVGNSFHSPTLKIEEKHMKMSFNQKIFRKILIHMYNRFLKVDT